VKEGLESMKILVLGTGVIGTTYAWQLSQAGADVTLWVRPERKQEIEQDGLSLDCIDLRRGRRVHHTIYRPAVIDTRTPANGYDLILVSVSADKLTAALVLLGEQAGKTDIMFFQNIWSGLDIFDRSLDAGQYFFGYPFMAGGGRDAEGIQSVIFGHSLAATMLGEKDGRITPRIKKVAHLLAKARMAPRLSRQIVPYLWTHYVWAASSVGAYLKAGSFEAFVGSQQMVRESYLAMREGFAVCKERGADVRRVFPNNLFALLPLPLLVPYSQRLYNTPEMKRMFDGHIQHSPGEMGCMYDDLLTTGKLFGLEMPIYQSFQPFVDAYLARSA
jgi:2-dehydropantoate 2-reductase